MTTSQLALPYLEVLCALLALRLDMAVLSAKIAEVGAGCWMQGFGGWGSAQVIRVHSCTIRMYFACRRISSVVQGSSGW